MRGWGWGDFVILERKKHSIVASKFAFLLLLLLLLVFYYTIKNQLIIQFLLNNL
jgi:hypothetical protein